MTTVSLQVMAHPRRAALVADLLGRLDLGDEHVTWDRKNDRWDTGRRAWEAVAERGEVWGLVVQDDALPCRDLVPGLARALELVPPRVIVSAYAGSGPRQRPMDVAFQHAAAEADAVGASWLLTGKLQCGVALALPLAEVSAALEHGDRMRWPEYDRRLGLHFHELGWRTYYAWPSLVEHRGRSLVGHVDGLRALRFAGAETSALDLPWNQRVVAVQADQFDPRVSR